MRGIFFARVLIWDYESWQHWHYKSESYNWDHCVWVWNDSLEDLRDDLPSAMRNDFGEVDIMYSQFPQKDIRKMDDGDFDFAEYLNHPTRKIDDVDFLEFEYGHVI